MGMVAIAIDGGGAPPSFYAMREFAFWGGNVRSIFPGNMTSLGLGILKLPDEIGVIKEVVDLDDARSIVDGTIWSHDHIRDFNQCAPYWDLESEWLETNVGIILAVKMFFVICDNNKLEVLFKRARSKICLDKHGSDVVHKVPQDAEEIL